MDLKQLHLALGEESYEVSEILSLYLKQMSESLVDILPSLKKGNSRAAPAVGCMTPWS